MKITLAALGGGSLRGATAEVLGALARADLIIGSERLVKELPSNYTNNRKACKRATEIFALLEHADCRHTVVLYSGDTGFYSGAASLIRLLEEHRMRFQVLPGVSSAQLLAARLGIPWQDWNLVSAHGVSCDPVTSVMKGTTLFLTGGSVTPADLCAELAEAGLGSLKAAVGEDLSYESEQVYTGTVGGCVDRTFGPLSVLLVQGAPVPDSQGVHLPDSAFVRGDVPMTKQLVRAAVLAKLNVQPEDVLWDIGAGTGSISIELARAASEGRVYAVEHKEAACLLLRENRERLCAWNLTVVRGTAPEALTDLPEPSAVFVGGTGGYLPAILDTVLDRNPDCRIVVSAITLDTLQQAQETLKRHNLVPEVTQLSVTHSETAGSHTLMKAENPIYLIAGNLT